MKILVTGANGYLGQGIVKALLDDGVDVIATGRRTDRIDERAQIMECDLFSVKDPYDYFGCPDVLLHLAWRDGFVHYSDAHIQDLPSHYSFLKAFANDVVIPSDNFVERLLHFLDALFVITRKEYLFIAVYQCVCDNILNSENMP